MKLFFQLLILFVGFQSFAQQSEVLDFEPLILIGAIPTEEISELKKIDSLANDSYFFVDHYKDNHGLFFVLKDTQQYLLYEFSAGHYANWSPCEIIMSNDRFINIVSYRSYGGDCAAAYGQTILFDITQLTYTHFFHYYHFECFDENGEPNSFKKHCYTSILNGDTLEIRPLGDYKIYKEFIKTGDYVLEKGTFVRIPEEDMKIRCLHRICKGMNISELNAMFPHAIFTKRPMYYYGYDSDALGIEISVDKEVLLFVACENNVVTGVTFVSSQYDFNGITTKNTISNILDEDPTQALNLDLITNWEYIYIYDLQLRIIFKTDASNRIGKYKDPEYPAWQILRENVKIDMIQMN